jgi:hypothetical protein
MKRYSEPWHSVLWIAEPLFQGRRGAGQMCLCGNCDRGTMCGESTCTNSGSSVAPLWRSQAFLRLLIMSYAGYVIKFLPRSKRQDIGSSEASWYRYVTVEVADLSYVGGFLIERSRGKI